MRLAVLAAVAATLLAPPALGQDSSQTAISGEVSLRSGFTPDPQRVAVTAGGTIDASKLGGACKGRVSNAPDYEVTYSAGSFPLVFRTVSSADTTLVINGPDGSWFCDDDSFGDGDAEVRFNRPSSGTYDIWVGRYDGGTASATLIITETP